MTVNSVVSYMYFVVFNNTKVHQGAQESSKQVFVALCPSHQGSASLASSDTHSYVLVPVQSAVPQNSKLWGAKALAHGC